jgi:hypothetical protein
MYLELFGSLLLMVVTFFCYGYTPLFDFFIELQESAFRVIADNYVTDDGRKWVLPLCSCFWRRQSLCLPCYWDI